MRFPRPFALSLLSSAIAALVSSGCPGDGPGGGGGGVTILEEVELGSFVITEIGAEPNKSSREFIEILNVHGGTVDLRGCLIEDLGDSSHDVSIGASTEIAAGEYAVLARHPFLGADEGDLDAAFDLGDDLVLAHDDSTETIRISCPDGQGGRQVIAEVSYNWQAEGYRRGHTRQLVPDPTALTGDEDLDDPALWCEAPIQDDSTWTYPDDDGEPVTEYGTPLGPTVCETPGGATPAEPGDVLITELLIGDLSGTFREWIELHNPTDRALDLRRCALVDSSIVDGEDIKTHELDAEIGDTVIPAGGWMLLGKSGADLFYGLANEAPDPPDATPQYVYSTLSFTNSEAQSLALDCPTQGGGVEQIDWVVYDWSDYSDRYRGWSWSLSSGALDHEDNDEVTAWCVAREEDLVFRHTEVTTDDDDTDVHEVHGTPGAPNPPCPVPPRRAGEGELVITEILVAQPTGVREWFEVHNPGGEDLSLLGCTVELAEAEGPDAPAVHEVVTANGSSTVPAGGYLLLSPTDFDIIRETELLMSDYHYTFGGPSFVTSRAQRLALRCPGGAGPALVDQIGYDWRDFSALGSGWSLSLDPGSLTAAGNDAPEAWCPARAEDRYFQQGDVSAYGTPGALNPACPVPDPWPAVGEVAVTEILGAPQIANGEEWFELKNTTGNPLRLDGCTLDDNEGSNTHVIAAAGGLSIGGNAYAVFAKTSATGSLACGLPSDYEYGSISFNNSGTETFKLICPDNAGGPDVTVDSVTYSGSAWQAGRGWQATVETAVGNDTAENWCSVYTAQATWSCTDPAGSGETNYGTPGAAAICDP